MPRRVKAEKWLVPFVSRRFREGKRRMLDWKQRTNDDGEGDTVPEQVHLGLR